MDFLCLIKSGINMIIIFHYSLLFVAPSSSTTRYLHTEQRHYPKNPIRPGPCYTYGLAHLFFSMRRRSKKVIAIYPKMRHQVHQCYTNITITIDMGKCTKRAKKKVKSRTRPEWRHIYIYICIYRGFQICSVGVVASSRHYSSSSSRRS